MYWFCHQLFYKRICSFFILSTTFDYISLLSTGGRLGLEKSIAKPFSIEEGVVTNDFFSTENIGLIYLNSFYKVEVVEDSHGWWYRERLSIVNKEERLKYGISFESTKSEILQIIKNEYYFDSLNRIIVSYDDIHIQFDFVDNILVGIELLRGD